MQAERKSSTSTHIPDLDNANVGTYKMNLREILWCISFFIGCGCFYPIEYVRSGFTWKGSRANAFNPGIDN